MGRSSRSQKNRPPPQGNLGIISGRNSVDTFQPAAIEEMQTEVVPGPRGGQTPASDAET